MEERKQSWSWKKQEVGKELPELLGKAPDEMTCPLCFSTCLSLPTHWHGGRQGKTISVESEAVYEFGIVWTSFASPTLPIP